MLVLVVMSCPVAAALLTAALRGPRWSPVIPMFSSLAVLAGGAALAADVLRDGPTELGNDIVRADALSAFMILVIGAVALLASWFGVSYVREEMGTGTMSATSARRYGILVNVFVATMLLAVSTGNLGIMWVAIEGTTIATAFLVGHHRTRASLEASWKYVIICSVGIVLAFLGTVLLAYAGSHAETAHDPGMSWARLVAAGGHLDPAVMRLAVVLLLLGYGTKVGLAPMHSWLPDAHSQAPAPVSALMSGALLSVALYAIIRVKAIADLALGHDFVRLLLVVGGLASLAVAGSLMLAQRDYKRMLAYSSIEHMGFAALGVAIGTPLALFGVLLQVLGHALGKSVVFLGSGALSHIEGTTAIDAVRALLTRRPALGATFGLGVLALLGFPPFPLFFSEITIVRAGFEAGLGAVMGGALILMTIVFAAMIGHTQRMLLGSVGARGSSGRTPARVLAPLVAGLVALLALGISTWPVEALLHGAARSVGS